MSYVEELSRRKLELMKELDAINLLLNIVNSDRVNEGFSKSKKPKEADLDLTDELTNASQPEQFLIMLRETKRFMKIREIARMLVDIVGGEEDERTVKLSRVTGKLKKLNRIKSYKVGASNTNVFWGSPNWIDSQGEIKKEYMYNEDAIEKSGSSSLPDLK